MSTRQEALRKRVERMIEKYCPDRMGDKDSILARYEGHEEELLQAYVRKYGPEPPAPKRGPDQWSDAEVDEKLRVGPLVGEGQGHGQSDGASEGQRAAGAEGDARQI